MFSRIRARPHVWIVLSAATHATVVMALVFASTSRSREGFMAIAAFVILGIVVVVEAVRLLVMRAAPSRMTALAAVIGLLLAARMLPTWAA